MTTDNGNNVTSFVISTFMSSKRNQFYPHPSDPNSRTNSLMHSHRAYMYTLKLTDFQGAHESSESILGDIFRFPSLAIYCSFFDCPVPIGKVK
jgi:hypothetical protein